MDSRDGILADCIYAPLYRLGRHWNAIQAYLLPGIEDETGELSEELKRFVDICELLIRDGVSHYEILDRWGAYDQNKNARGRLNGMDVLFKDGRAR